MTSSSPKNRFVRSFEPSPAAAQATAVRAAAAHFTPTFGTGLANPPAARPPRPPVPTPAQTGVVGALDDQDSAATVVRGVDAGTAAEARFDTDLSESPSLPGDLARRLWAEAQATGYATGWSQGRQEAQLAGQAARDQAAAQARDTAAAQAGRVGQAFTAVAGAAAAFERRMVPAAAEIEDIILATAYALAEQIVGRELAVAVEPGRDAIARALAFAPVNRPVTVRLHPGDYATVTQLQPGLVEIEGRTVNLLADATLRPGDAVAECDATTIDARIEPALMRVREVLGL